MDYMNLMISENTEVLTYRRTRQETWSNTKLKISGNATFSPPQKIHGSTKCRRKVKSRRPGFEKLLFGFYGQYISDDFRKLSATRQESGEIRKK